MRRILLLLLIAFSLINVCLATDEIIDGNLTVTGSVTAASTIATKDTLHAYGITYLDSTLNVNGAAFLDSTLNVAGSTTLDSTLNVNGEAKFFNDLSIEESLSVGSEVSTYHLLSPLTAGVTGFTLCDSSLNFYEYVSPTEKSYTHISRIDDELYLYFDSDLNSQSNQYTKTVINKYGMRVGFADDLDVFDTINNSNDYYTFGVDGSAVVTAFLRVGAVDDTAIPSDLNQYTHGDTRGDWDSEFYCSDAYMNTIKLSTNMVINCSGETPEDYSSYSLAVNGTILTKEVQVKSAENWPDYVFGEEYDLPELNEVESYIKANKHLPDVPSKLEAEEDGYGLAEMQTKLLKKVEELTLYVIELQKQNEELRIKMDKLAKE